MNDPLLITLHEFLCMFPFGHIALICVQLVVPLYCTDMSVNDSRASKPFRIYNAQTLGAAIRYYRAAEGMSQTELAERTSIPRNYVNALENGHETEHLSRLLTVLRELGVRMTLDKADW